MLKQPLKVGNLGMWNANNQNEIVLINCKLFRNGIDQKFLYMDAAPKKIIVLSISSLFRVIGFTNQLLLVYLNH